MEEDIEDFEKLNIDISSEEFKWLFKIFQKNFFKGGALQNAFSKKNFKSWGGGGNT